MKTILTAAAIMVAFGTSSYAQTIIDSNDSKAKRKAKVAKHNTKTGWNNTKSDVKTGVKAAKANRQSR